MTQPPTEACPKPNRTQKPRGRRRLLICLALLVPLAFAGLTYFYAQRTGAHSLAEALAESERLDPNWRLADLEATRQPYPAPEKNSINLVLEVRSAMPPTAWPEWPFPQAGTDPAKLAELRRLMDASLDHDRLAPTLLNSEQERALRAEIGRAKAAIDLARQLDQYSYGRFPVKWSNDLVSTMLPHVQNVRETASMLRYDGLLRAHDQDLHGALHDVTAILHASRAIGDEETFISQLVRIACDAVAMTLLERSLACGTAQESDLASLQKELEIEAHTPFFLTGLRGERANLDLMFETVQKGEISFPRYRQILLTMGSWASLFGGKSFASSAALELNALRMFLNIRGERARHLNYLNQIALGTKLPTWQALDVIESTEKAQSGNLTLGAGLISSCFRLYAADLRARATAVEAVLSMALALERYRLVNGKWPETLAELAPRYLSEVPLDPFDGAPLRLVRRGSALIVYSVSQDKQDQGGTLLPNPTVPGSDIGFVLQDPAARRSPGKPFEFPDWVTHAR